jgi:trans-aconitate 2-methyltransferase
MDRICEPELMDDPLQAQAYAAADFGLTDQAFTERILALLSSRSHPGVNEQKILDLGCGPGNISFRLADALPEAKVLGIDGAAAMLALAEERRNSQPARWPFLHFHQARLPLSAEGLAALSAGFGPPYGVIVSNSLLHHLHDPAVLWQAVVQWAGPGTLVMVRDLRRPPSTEALQELVERHAADAPDVLRRDFANSLAAAFLPEEVEAQLEPAGLSCLKVETIEDRYLEVRGQLPEASPQ